VGNLLSTVLAQPTAVGTLERALAAGRVHHAYLFEGPPGVGKERAAFGLAQALVCEAPQNGRACGACSACQRALPREGERRPVHPDVVVIERGLYEPSQIGRRTPETQDISIDQVRTLVLARAAFSAHEGRAKVFIVRRAEEMNQSAANALLKTLEEPGRGTHFVLMTSQPEALLPTIRSRTQRVRFAPLPAAIVERLLSERGVDAARAAEIARLAAGSMETALALADPDASDRRDTFVEKALAALDAPTLGPALDVAEAAKKSSREDLATHIAALGTALAARARADADVDSATARYWLTLAAIEQLEQNASAQLVVESMLSRMRSA